MKKFAQTIRVRPNGETVIRHDLETEDVVVQVWEKSSVAWRQAPVELGIVDANNIKITIERMSGTGELRVVVVG